MALFSGGRQFGGPSMGINKWSPVSYSRIFGSYRSDKDFVKCTSRSGIHKHVCRCKIDCNCHWESPQKPTCPCSALYAECALSCPGCDKARKRGLTDNTQIRREGELVKFGESYWIDND